MSSTDKVFAGAIPGLYEQYLVPLLFEPYAADLARRLAGTAPRRLLEVAAGTGVVTRALASTLPDSTIVAVDLNQGMLDEAAALPIARPVEWRQGDAMDLPFADASFDVVVCQFGVMFFPDKPRALAQFKRVLRPGGTLIYSVWDRVSDNEFADAVETGVAGLFPADPPRFLSRTPYGYFERARIEQDLAAAGIERSVIETVIAHTTSATSREPAIAFCQGTPLRSEIEARDQRKLAEATDAGAALVARRLGSTNPTGKLQAHIVTVTFGAAGA